MHQGKCKMKRVYEVEKILDFRRTDPKSGTPIGYGKTEFLVKWKGYSSKENQWLPYENVAPDVIKEFLQKNGLWDEQWEHRCPICDKPASSERGVRTHMRRKKDNCNKFL